MKTALVPTGSRLVDSLPFSQQGTAAQAAALKAAGVDGLIGYLGAMNAERLRYVLDAGLGFMPVTFAGAYNNGPQDEILQLRALGIPAGTTVWLDMEGRGTLTDVDGLKGKINAWAGAIKAMGYEPGLYCGVPQPFTSAELYALAVVRYWESGSDVRDRNNALAKPNCGYCLRQFLPQGFHAGVFVDFNMVGQDFKGRLPTWCVA